MSRGSLDSQGREGKLDNHGEPGLYMGFLDTPIKLVYNFCMRKIVREYHVVAFEDRFPGLRHIDELPWRENKSTFADQVHELLHMMDRLIEQIQVAAQLATPNAGDDSRCQSDTTTSASKYGWIHGGGNGRANIPKRGSGIPPSFPHEH